MMRHNTLDEVNLSALDYQSTGRHHLLPGKDTNGAGVLNAVSSLVVVFYADSVAFLTYMKSKQYPALCESLASIFQK